MIYHLIKRAIELTDYSALRAVNAAFHSAAASCESITRFEIAAVPCADFKLQANHNKN